MTRHTPENAESLQKELDALRSIRVYKDRDVGIGNDLKKLARGYSRDQKGLGEIAEHWQQLASPGVQESASLRSFARGVLAIDVPDASVKYMLDRELRSGLQRSLIRAAGASLRSVRVAVRQIPGE